MLEPGGVWRCGDGRGGVCSPWFQSKPCEDLTQVTYTHASAPSHSQLSELHLIPVSAAHPRAQGSQPCTPTWTASSLHHNNQRPHSHLSLGACHVSSPSILALLIPNRSSHSCLGSSALCFPLPDRLGGLIELEKELEVESGELAVTTTGCFRLGIGMEEDMAANRILQVCR